MNDTKLKKFKVILTICLIQTFTVKKRKNIEDSLEIYIKVNFRPYL